MFDLIDRETNSLIFPDIDDPLILEKLQYIRKNILNLGQHRLESMIGLKYGTVLRLNPTYQKKNKTIDPTTYEKIRSFCIKKYKDDQEPVRSKPVLVANYNFKTNWNLDYYIPPALNSKGIVL